MWGYIPATVKYPQKSVLSFSYLVLEHPHLCTNPVPQKHSSQTALRPGMPMWLCMSPQWYECRKWCVQLLVLFLTINHLLSKHFPSPFQRVGTWTCCWQETNYADKKIILRDGGTRKESPRSLNDLTQLPSHTGHVMWRRNKLLFYLIHFVFGLLCYSLAIP